MRINEVQIFEGRNIYSHRPVAKVTLQLASLSNKESCEYPDFIVRLLRLLPGLKEHACSGNPGGFLARLNAGTYFGHIYEHVVLELQSMLGQNIRFGKTRQSSTPGEYYVVFEYGSITVVERLCRLALRVILETLAEREVALMVELEELRKIAADSTLGPSTQAIVDAAKRRGISVRRIGTGSLVQLGTGRHSCRIQASIGPRTSCLAADIACDKEMTKHILASAGVPVPYGLTVFSAEEAVKASQKVGPSVVVKPFDGNQGKGVSLRLTTAEQVTAAYNMAKQYSPRVIVEEHINGRHYRLLTVDHKLVAVAERIPAHVDGDGVSSVSQLVKLANSDPLRGYKHEKPLTRISVDEVTTVVLANQSLTMDSVPEKDQRVYLRDNANLSTGGIALDVTDQVHSSVKELAERVSVALDLDIAGIDMVVPNIAEPFCEGAVIEVNAAPGLRMHIFPSQGQSRDVAGAILDMIYPDGVKADIPIVAVTGTNGKTTTCRLVAAGLGRVYQSVGLATSAGISVNQKVLVKGDTTGPWSSKLLLSDKNVDVAVLEVARGGILHAGLGYDLADVAVLTNITEDHLGQDGVLDLEDMGHVKGLVAEAVRKTGHVIANGTNQYCLEAAKRAGRSTILFSATPCRAVLWHLACGGKAVFAAEGYLTMAEGQDTILRVNLNDMPLTFSGTAQYNIENCAAAAAALWGAGVGFACIADVLKEFSPDLKNNPGRQNILSVKGVRVMVDYGHNVAGLAAVSAMARTMCQGRLLGVICGPGDRTDEALTSLGRCAGQHFDAVYIKEDRDRRKRQVGEVAALLAAGTREAGLPSDKVHTHLDEPEAISAAMLEASEDDMMVVLYEDLDQTLGVLEQLQRPLQATEEQTVVAGVIGV